MSHPNIKDSEPVSLAEGLIDALQPRALRSPRAITLEMRRALLQDHKDGMCHKDLAAKYGLSYSRVSSLCRQHRAFSLVTSLK